MASGGHTIRGEQPRSTGSGCFGYVVIFVVLLALMAFCSKPPSDSSLSSNQAPSQKTATFYSDLSASAPLLLSITGGSYIIKYVTISQTEFHNFKRAADMFVADFQTGKTYGSLELASVILLHGSCNVEIGTFKGYDSVEAKFSLKDSNFVSATFNASAPSTGPPRHIRPKTIFVAGEIKDFSFGGFKGKSKADLSVLELDPSQSEWERYHEQKQQDERHREIERARSRPRFIP